ncbi:Uncharacterized membrane protein YckC, RDD family [Alteromonadaceae bacterium Bs31]|nr:Uncharacterized membrane protein YckC, RDD family [Alteromonadaceae bacterium Bs31]
MSEQTDTAINTSRGAPLWRRFASMVYDSFLLLALAMAYGAFVTFLLFLTQGDTTGGEYQPMITSELGNALVLIGLIASLSGFYIFFWCRAGQTAGMRAWRLQVVERRELPHIKTPGFKNALVRAPLALLSLLFFGAGYFWGLFNKEGDCLHDKLSNTRVILTESRKRKKK